jgi:Flp pilus assembly protein TadG
MRTELVAAFHRLWTRFARSEDGQIAVMFALAVMPITIGVGAAVDYSRGSQVRTNLQAALDSAMLAAAVDGTSNWQQVALNTFSGNFNPRGSTVATPSFALSNGIYSGSVTASAPTAFLGVVSIKTLSVTARSASTTSKVPVCVLGLNAFDSGAFDMNGNSKFNAPDCAVQANTSDNKGMTQEGKPTAVAQKFSVSGGHTGAGYSSPPKDGAATVADPYASMPFPSYSACDKNAKGLVINGGTTTLSPGTYCGGITIKGQANVTLNPGIYVMVSGAFLTDGGSSVTGKEVMIAFTGTDATLRLWGNSTLNLTSPISGTYANFQFFQDENDANGRGSWVSIGGNGNTNDASKASWDGIAYFPTQNFWVYGNTQVNANSANMSVVAGEIWIQGNATLNVTHNNTRNLPVAQTTTAGGARLIQ